MRNAPVIQKFLKLKLYLTRICNIIMDRKENLWSYTSRQFNSLSLLISDKYPKLEFNVNRPNM